jgi:hypothetical protein
MKIRSTALAAFIVFISCCIMSCGDSAPAEKPADNAGNKKALEEIKKEPKITEAFINDANVLYVSVADDGTRRDGYAQYLCGILKENQASSKWVKVMKLGSINDPKRDNAYGVLLGESKCE